MSQWDDKERSKVVREITHKEVGSYIEFGMHVTKYDAYDTTQADSCRKTFVISCGMCDGENIDLFDLQEWFDKNRTWIDTLRQEAQA